MARQIDALILRERAFVHSNQAPGAPLVAKAVEIHPVTGIAVDTAPGKLLNVPATFKTATVQIDWGDGSPADTSNVGNSQGFIIPTASHTYQHTGSFTTVVTFSTADRVLGAASQTVTVTDVSSGGLHLTAVTGTRFINVVGTISHLDPQQTPGPLSSPYAVGIDWGDGTRSMGTFVSLGNNRYQVTGAHIYAKAGSYRVTAFGGINGTFPWPIPGTAQPLNLPADQQFTTAYSLMTVTGGDVAVPPPSVQATGQALPDTHVGTPVGAPAAKLTGLGVDAYRADLYAVIDWGDGTLTDAVGPITDFENGAFLTPSMQPPAVQEDIHEYSASGTYTITVTFLLNDHTDTTQNTVLASATTSLTVLP